MNTRTLIDAFYRIIRKLPIAGKIMALASMTTLYYAINPSVKDFDYFDPRWAYEKLVEVNGKLKYSGLNWPQRYHKRITYVPDHYINTSEKPKVNDRVVIVYLNEEDKEKKLYLLNLKYDCDIMHWHKMILEDKKSEKRTKLLFMFVFSAGISLGSYPGLIDRLLSLASEFKKN